MLERVREILSDYTDVTDVTENLELVGDLGLSSFDMVSIVSDFEQEFGIEIADRDIRHFVSVGDLVGYLSSRRED